MTLKLEWLLATSGKCLFANGFRLGPYFFFFVIVFFVCLFVCLFVFSFNKV